MESEQEIYLKCQDIEKHKAPADKLIIEFMDISDSFSLPWDALAVYYAINICRKESHLQDLVQKLLKYADQIQVL